MQKQKPAVKMPRSPEKSCQCQTCGTIFITTHRRAFCDEKCRRLADANNCEVCQKPTKGRRPRFCSIQCANKGKDDGKRYAIDRSWLACSFCLGRVGFGAPIVSRLVKVHFVTVYKAWAESGFKPCKPKGGNWQAATGQTHNAGKFQTPSERLENYYRSGEWKWVIIQHYREEEWASKNPDKTWKELYYNRFYVGRASLKKYQSMSAEERRAHNQRTMQRRKEIHGQRAITEKMRIYKKKRMATDPAFKIGNNLRSRMWACIKRLGAHPDKWPLADLVGCDGAFLKRHLESQFKKWMTWGNYGKKWHVDHYVPCSRFDLNKAEEVRRCFHWSNLRPLCATENIRRGAAKGTDLQPQLELTA